MSQESANFIVEKVHGNHDFQQIKKQLDRIHGACCVNINDQHNLVSVDYDSSGTSYDEIENRLNKMGYEIAADASCIQTR